jgi:alanine dehydrogenase
LGMLVLTRADVEELLDLDELMGALARAQEELSSGNVSMPPRIAALTADGLLGAMPAYLPSAGLGCKLVTLFPHNTDRPTHQAAIVLFDPENGSPIALMDGTYITATRTAAAAALAARLLARADAKILAILGTGVQARTHMRAFAAVRDWAEIRIAGRDAEKTEVLAAEFGARATSFEDAVRGADVVAAATHSAEPVVRSGWVAPGTHVSSVGYNAPGSELDPELVRAATIVVESRDSSFAPPPGGAPELAGVDPASVAELGELVSGSRRGRTTPVEITLYKSVGIAVQDLAAAALVLAAAREREVGLEIELEEIRA